MHYFHQIDNYIYQDNTQEAKINGKSSPKESKLEILFLNGKALRGYILHTYSLQRGYHPPYSVFYQPRGPNFAVLRYYFIPES